MLCQIVELWVEHAKWRKIRIPVSRFYVVCPVEIHVMRLKLFAKISSMAKIIQKLIETEKHKPDWYSSTLTLNIIDQIAFVCPSVCLPFSQSVSLSVDSNSSSVKMVVFKLEAFERILSIESLFFSSWFMIRLIVAYIYFSLHIDQPARHIASTAHNLTQFVWLTVISFSIFFFHSNCFVFGKNPKPGFRHISKMLVVLSPVLTFHKYYFIGLWPCSARVVNNNLCCYCFLIFWLSNLKLEMLNISILNFRGIPWMQMLC